MLFEDFAQSWFNRSHRVAGRKLRPFCLWHFTYLHFVNSPLAPGARPGARSREQGVTEAPPLPGWADIEVATRICRLRHEECLPSAESVLRRLYLKVRLFVVMARTTEEEARKAFYDYVADYFAPPRFNEWTSHGKTRGGPPDPLAVASACIMLFGGAPKVEKWVWELPIGKAYWYASTLHYKRGAPLDYVTSRQEAIRRSLRKKMVEGKLRKYTPEERAELRREALTRAAEFVRQRQNNVPPGLAGLQQKQQPARPEASGSESSTARRGGPSPSTPFTP